MIQLNEIFSIGEHKCKVGYDADDCFFWIIWLDVDGRTTLEWLPRERFFKAEFGHSSMYDVIKEAAEGSPLRAINYKEIRHSDCPDFYNLEDLTKYVEELRNIIFFNHFRELILN